MNKKSYIKPSISMVTLTKLSSIYILVVV